MNPESPYPRLEVSRKSGDEVFRSSREISPFDLQSFWRWSASDLVCNATRGVLAEFLVAKALDLPMESRAEWDAYDLKFGTTTIEVKSAAYLQSWHQEKLSSISFGIAPSRAWNPKTGEFHEELERQAELYVFCLLETKDQSMLDPMDLDQWIFYVLPSETLNQKSRTQKTIALSPLLQLGAEECRFDGLRNAVEKEGERYGATRHM